jgi:DNA-binding NarL/FixJ family response regulator
MLRILIGDDHAVFRRGTKDVLCEHFPSIEVGEAKTGSEMVALAARSSWDAMIMDITMPGKSGTELLEDLRRIHPNTPILVFSMHPEESYAVRMIRAGASGYLNKSTALDELISAVQGVLLGQEYVSPAVARCLMERVREKPVDRLHETLSNREFQVLRMLAMGCSLKEIAADLSLSANTVSTYRTRVLDKLKVKSNAELTRYALTHSLI